MKGLGRAEVHIYDSDVARYGEACKQVNGRTDGSWAVQTEKREIENYLHSDAIQESLSISVTVEDQNDIPEIVGKQKGWNSKTAKKKLAAYAFPKMTAERLRQRDPKGEIEALVRRIAKTLEG